MRTLDSCLLVKILFVPNTIKFLKVNSHIIMEKQSLHNNKYLVQSKTLMMHMNFPKHMSSVS